MSGVYLIVWDAKKNPWLKQTKGGWPHITVAYTGEHLSQLELRIVAKAAVDDFLVRGIQIVGARINSFVVEKTGAARHDVLLELDAATTQLVKDVRIKYFAGHPSEHELSMSRPHITYSIHDSKEDAKIALSRVLAMPMPSTVFITGVAID